MKLHTTLLALAIGAVISVPAFASGDDARISSSTNWLSKYLFTFNGQS